MANIIKRDTGRKYWREQIEVQGKSGKTIQAFCEEHQLKRHTFFYWKKKFQDLAHKDLAVERLPNRFIPIPRASHLAEKSPRIYLPNGVQIELGAGLESITVNQLIQK